MSSQSSIAENNTHQNHTNNPFSIKGRFSRSSFLAWNFLWYLPFIIIGIVMSLMTDPAHTDFINVTSGFAQLYASIEMYSQEKEWAIVAPIIFLIVPLSFFTINTIFLIRRLHDIDRSGWFSLLIILPVPATISFIYFATTFDGISTSAVLLLMRITLLVNLGFILFLLIKKGTQDVNRFGSVRETLKWEKIMAILAPLLIAVYVLIQ